MVSTDTNTEANLNWTNPQKDNFTGIVILRKTETDILDKLEEGVLYNPDDTIGIAKVVYVDYNWTATRRVYRTLD